ncbi:MAG TPA: hypothetical protein VJ203_11005 [Bacteroidales bacterium]|nr:hypothetical protein [Bacteroidales bacterium]
MLVRLFTAVTLIVILYVPDTSGQFYSTGEAPASVRWNKIITPHFTLVYPRNDYATANRMANLLEHYRTGTADDMDYRAGKMPVILHNTSVISNGYVTWAPRRMEVVTTAPQDGYGEEWMAQLALHEFRHIVQIGSLNRGITGALTLVTGEIATGAVSSMIPSWFYEGDAVVNETMHSGSGRGRIPGFEMPLRTLLLQHDGIYSFDKGVFGSYRDHVPSAYQYGYQMISYARSRYGRDTWASALDYTARNPFLIWPLALHLKKQYGIFKSTLYQQTMDSLKYLYSKQEDTITYTDYKRINRERNGTFTQYRLPKDLHNGHMVVLKTGLDHPDRFVIIDTAGREKTVHVPGYFPGIRIDVHNNRLVWDEIAGDPRWERRNYSEIRVLDLTTMKDKTLTRKTRYFSPAFSPGGERLVVAETDGENNHFITVLDAISGEPVSRISSPGGSDVQQPQWISDSVVVVITVSESGKQIELIGVEDSLRAVVLRHTRFDISEPVNYDNYILFRSSFGGIENIYSVNKATGDVFQVTNSRFGAWHPEISTDNTKLLFSEYSAEGFNLVSADLDPVLWKKISLPAAPSGIWPGTRPGEGITASGSGQVPDVRYAATPYNKLSHLLRIHSWLPFYTGLDDFSGSIDELPVNLGFMLFSQNLLSTFISSVGYRYANGYHAVLPTLSWRGWYPVIELTGEYGGPLRLAGRLPEGTTLPEYNAAYTGFTLRAYIPLQWDRGRYITRMVPRVEYEWSNTRYYAKERIYTGIDYLHWRYALFHYYRMAHRDLYPRWGQSLTAVYTQTPADHSLLGNMFFLEAGLFFPGLYKHHHLYLRGGYQHQQVNNYFLPINRISFPRGFESNVSESFACLAANYAFPVICPDWSLGPFIYLKRLRMNLFHDWSYGSSVVEITGAGSTLFTGNYWSYGTEIVADLHFIRFIFPLSAGVRVGYKPGRKEMFSELMLSIHTGVF